MVYLGERDTMIASDDAAAVCDLHSSRYVALVQNRIGNIEVPLVQRAIALSTADGRRALVFHSGGASSTPRRSPTLTKFHCSAICRWLAR
jgi:hypothetical protein